MWTYREIKGDKGDVSSKQVPEMLIVLYVDYIKSFKSPPTPKCAQVSSAKSCLCIKFKIKTYFLSRECTILPDW